MLILGLSAFAHDSAAALFRDGEIACMAEEERWNREKHTGAFPLGAIGSCLAEAGVAAGAVDRVAFFLRPDLVGARLDAVARDFWPRSALATARGGALLAALEPRLRAGLAEAGIGAPVAFVEHHLAHAASAFLLSPFERAAILTADGKGEWSSTTLGRGEGTRVSIHEEILFPHSLGYLYSVVTKWLGFHPWGGEGKVQGLAAYGEPRFVPELRRLLLPNEDGSFRLDLQFFRHHLGLPWISRPLARLLGPPRSPDAPLEQRHEDVAASLQAVLEEALLRLATRLRAVSGEPRLCCAGGVFLNSTSNARLRDSGIYEDVFVQPVSHDAGAALGAALAVHAEEGGARPAPLAELTLGPALSDDEAARALVGSGLEVTRCEDPTEPAARLLAEGRVIGWVQGRLEVGPRALGARSILADPRRAEMKDLVNERVKKREPFRPFAPAVLAEKCAEWFERPGPFPWMIVCVPVRRDRRAQIPAVVHQDGTARVQTVDARTQPLFHRLISRFEAATGVPVLLNTSFNLRGEPMVRGAEDAVSCMLRTDLEHLFVGGWWARKPRAPAP
ncbi:MAG: hypothetical protein L0216_14495 [Planctomycetales bacterium]|nr:hypothetical protein [Planctomycetales bacterium]